jgi:hypothetical protein
VTDLAARDTAHLGRALVRAYRAAGGDPGPEALIAFHAVQHALVRCHDGLVRAAQLPPTGAAHGHESAAARDLLTLAERFAWQARLPLVLVVCGPASSGAAELAHALAEVSGIPHLSADVTRRRLAGIAPREDAGSAGLDRLVATELGRRAAAHVAAGGGAIVDAALGRRADREALVGGVAGAAPLMFVECVTPGPAPAEPWEPLDEVAADAHLTLRTDRDVAAVLADVVALLDQRLGPLSA